MMRVLKTLSFFLALGLVSACGANSESVSVSAVQAAPLSLKNMKTLPDFVSGGQPSPAELTAFAAAGYHSVINLRGVGEGHWDEEALTKTHQMAYIALPIAGAASITLGNAKALRAAIQSAQKPLLVHCASGNRVGALMAVAAGRLDGKSVEEAIVIGKAAGLTRLESAVRVLLTQP